MESLTVGGRAKTGPRRNEYRAKGGDALLLGVKADMMLFVGNTVWSISERVYFTLHAVAQYINFPMTCVVRAYATVLVGRALEHSYHVQQTRTWRKYGDDAISSCETIIDDNPENC